MLVNTLIELFERDLNRVIDEVNLYDAEVDLWRIEKNISNSGGNLVLHLLGNLNTYIGKEIGKTGYVRNRELEFSQKNIPRQLLVSQLKDTINVVKSSLKLLTEEDLNNEYPVVALSSATSTAFFLVHLLGHLNYHLGQINYHRRLVAA
ncbi:MAG: DUF1572 domain-containing protein [Flavobacterium sp.]|nr:MAG: DUF1572 domain-containing protein [Flavobacterium sp.]